MVSSDEGRVGPGLRGDVSVGGGDRAVLVHGGVRGSAEVSVNVALVLVSIRLSLATALLWECWRHSHWSVAAVLTSVAIQLELEPLAEVIKLLKQARRKDES